MAKKSHSRSADAESNAEDRSPYLEAWPIILAALFIFFWAAFTSLGTFSLSELRMGGIDPVSYYSWIRSPFFDHDFQFQNEYRTINPPGPHIRGSLVDPDGPRTATGHLPNSFSIGPAVLWSPFFLMAHGLAEVGSWEADGYSQPYFAAIFMANAVYGFLGAVLTGFALRTWWDGRRSALGAVAAWTCTSALYYSFPREAMAHACSFFAMALFFFAWARFREKTSLGHWALVGAALGLATLVRWQNLTFALIPAIDLLTKRTKEDAVRLAVCAAGTAVIFFPQMIGWKIVYGAYLTTPQGASFMEWTRPNFLGLLFSSSSGLFLWTPLCLAAFVGLFLWKSEHGKILIPLSIAVLVQVYVAACAGDAGWSFGARRLVNCAPLFAAGLIALVTHYRIPTGWAVATVAAFAFWNFLFVLQYAGILDGLYTADALTAYAQEHGVTSEFLQQTTRLPTGEAFDLNAFAEQHKFPRDGGLTFKQLITDKLTVLFVIFE